MSKTLINFWLDTLLLLIFLALLWTSFVTRFLFPAGTIADGWTLWGATYDQWFNVQFVLHAVFALAVLLHVMLHWSWVCGVLTSKILPRKKEGKRSWDDGIRTLYGVALIVIIFNLLGLAFAAAALMISRPTI